MNHNLLPYIRQFIFLFFLFPFSKKNRKTVQNIADIEVVYQNIKLLKI